MERVHASCVAIEGKGVLLRGPSGAGKSDLALRLIDAGATLVADDQVEVSRDGDTLYARPAARLAGLLEVRGLGILKMPYQERTRLDLIVDLVEPDRVERMPESRTDGYEEVSLPAVSLDPFTASALAKLRLALQMASGVIIALR